MPSYWSLTIGSIFAEIKTYRYWDANVKGLDFEGMIEDIEAAPAPAIVVLHLCCHNPTGVDPSQEQWKKIVSKVKECGHIAFFDGAYQGFASGDLDADAFPIRLAVTEGVSVMSSQSFSKNMGLYNERCGALSVHCSDSTQAQAVSSRIKKFIRPMYSNPPSHGARVASLILSNESLFQEWKSELQGMYQRIKNMRQELYDSLQAEGATGNWQHVLDQFGMFCFTGLSQEQARQLTEEHHIYLLPNGRINVAGINSENVRAIAVALAKVTRSSM